MALTCSIVHAVQTLLNRCKEQYFDLLFARSDTAIARVDWCEIINESDN
jgi:hypothetical protein